MRDPVKTVAPPHITQCGVYTPGAIPAFAKPAAAPADRPHTATPVSRAAAPHLQRLPIPDYLQNAYWWAYVHPYAVRTFERRWLINAILMGHYRRLCDACLSQLGDSVGGATLQVACVYGDLTKRLLERLAPDARLDVVDILAIQLENLAHKLPFDPRLRLQLGDASGLEFGDASFDQVLLFFLLHEQPELVRRATLAEAMRVVKPGGKIVVVDYHRPALWHPLRPLLRLVFGWLEPFAIDLWTNKIEDFLPRKIAPESLSKSNYFGGLYQIVVIRC
jgi:ubiquinone/menaquinone biosynthesis C-methylase UbiE